MKSVSEKQLAANRANAARSTGPRTTEGKLRSALNSRKHGLIASTFTASGVEESEELQNLIDDAIAHYQPQGSQERFAVERIALCQLAILRAHRIEAGLLGSAFAGGKQLVPPSHGSQRNTVALAEGFHLMAGDGPAFALLLRYQAQSDRQYRRAVEDFERLKAQREEIPNEPISEEIKEDAPEQSDRAPAAEGGPQPAAPCPQSPVPFQPPVTMVPCPPSTASSRP
jgi:hypothetical protein